LPFALQPLKAAMSKLDRKILELAEVSGLSPFRTFYRIVIPNVWPGIMAAAVITFAHTLGDSAWCLLWVEESRERPWWPPSPSIPA